MEYLDMTRQAVTQPLDVLEAANLVAMVRRGREKLHFRNPVPLQAIYERWQTSNADWRKPMARSSSWSHPAAGALPRRELEG